jgi:hypothetical protein
MKEEKDLEHFASCEEKTALFIDVPRLPTIRNILSLFKSLFAACTALGT